MTKGIGFLLGSVVGINSSSVSVVGMGPVQMIEDIMMGVD